jgi:outer membrane receptor for ferrienterochelin and colicins
MVALFLAVFASRSWAVQPATVAALKGMSLEELTSLKVDTVVGASKREQKISEAPANVTILTSEEIKLYGWRTLGEALRSVSGMVVTYDRGYVYLGVRGFNRPGDYSGCVLITVDGHRMNDAIYDTSAMDADFILDLDLIERIEVIRGPGSTLYGNNAFFGIINIITRKGRDVRGAELSGSYGTFDTYTGRITCGNRFTNGVELLLSGTIYNSEGNPRLYYPEFSSINNGVAEHMDSEHASSFFASVSWEAFTLEGGYVERFKRVPSAPFGTPDTPIVFNDPTFRTIDERAFADLKYQRKFDDDWEIKGRAYYDHYRYDGWYPYHYNPTDPFDPITVNYDLDQAESVGGEVQVSKQLFEKHRLLAGAEARYDYKLKLFNEDASPPATYLDVNESGYFAGGYVEDEFRMRDSLILNAGVRYDYFWSAGSAVSPRAALIWHPWTPSTFKLLYGQAYRAPNAYQSYYNWPLPANTPELNPETIRSYEVVYEHEFNRVWNAKASVYYDELENTISGNGNSGFVNLESATTWGVEAEAAAHWPGGLQGRASYTYSDARDDVTHARLSNSPEHMGKLNLAVPLWRKNVFAAAEIQAMSRRGIASGGSVDGFWLANLTLYSRELVKGLEVSASVYNVFDQRYNDPVSGDFLQNAIEQNGRTFRVKATWKF